MDGSDKDGLAADAVHVDTGASLNVIEVDVAKLGDQVDDIELLTHLHEWALIRTPPLSITYYTMHVHVHVHGLNNRQLVQGSL